MCYHDLGAHEPLMYDIHAALIIQIKHHRNTGQFSHWHCKSWPTWSSEKLADSFEWWIYRWLACLNRSHAAGLFISLLQSLLTDLCLINVDGYVKISSVNQLLPFSSQEQGWHLWESVKGKERCEKVKVGQEKWLSEEEIEEMFYHSMCCYIYAGIPFFRRVF